MTCGPHQYRPNGFTLIEVVVALALGVLLALGVQSLAVHALRSSKQIQTDAGAKSSASLPFEILAQDLRSLPAGAGVQLTDTGLSCTTLNSMQSPRSAARHAVAVRYLRRPDASGRIELLRQETEIGVDPDSDSGTIVAAGLEQVAWAVFDGRTWQNHWPPGTALPAGALRITLTRSALQPAEERVFWLRPPRWRHHHD